MADDRPTVAVAESCTGGLLALHLVATDGSGAWFKGGVVAYDTDVKQRLLGVPRGPVIDRATAMRMAEGVRALLAADIGVATTGVAGPDTEEGQPVGTIYVGLADESGTNAVMLVLDGDPPQVRDRASRHALAQVTHARHAAPTGYLSSQVAVPEGGFIMLSPTRLLDVSIVGTDVAFVVAGEPGEEVTIGLAGLRGEACPTVALIEPGVEPVRIDDGSLTVAAGIPVVLSWHPARLVTARLRGGVPTPTA